LAAPVREGKEKIRPRARLLRTIGAELISSEVVAVIELVRNSYDADADKVELVFHRPESPADATLEIRDNGHGMTLAVFKGPWLEPATDFKKKGRDGLGGAYSPGGRRRLGSKGVGRFAAQRLGEHLELRTRSADSPTEIVARFDWAAVDRDEYLDQVSVPWREQRAELVHHQGTHLRVSKLRDRWTPERFDKLRLGLARLVSPTMEEAFSITISINGAVETIKPAIDAQSAMYSIEGEVLEGGVCRISYSDLDGASETWERTVFWPAENHQTCGPFGFRINAWDLDKEALKYFLTKTGSRLGLRDFRRTIRDHSGISLYRDGFRILPYGEPDNDWLRLDRRRVNNPTMKLSNNQILGAIQLHADTNPRLQDQTNREGLVTNEAYHHLQAVVLELMGYLETRRFSARRSMDIEWQRKATSLPQLADDERDAHIDQLFTSLESGDEGRSEGVGQLREVVQEYRDAAADAVRHYASLAAAGQMAGLVFRQFDHPIRQMRSELHLVRDDLAGGGLDDDDLADLKTSVVRALELLDGMERRIQKLDPLAVGRRGRRLSRLRLNEVLVVVVDAWLDEFDRAGVTLDFKGDESVFLHTNQEVVQQVFSSLLDNALWFASQGESSRPMVSVQVGSKGFTVSDNGPGVPQNLREVVFEPHFTTRDEAHGMGLTLARDLLRTIGARVRLLSATPATFQVSFGR
jgi:signal transduction histidine kinase